MRGKSLLSDENDPVCYLCGSNVVALHHIYGGVGRRPVADEQGAWCFLCPAHHNASPHGVHFDRRLDLRLKRECQAAWEEREGIDDPEHDEFRKMFGISYL